MMADWAALVEQVAGPAPGIAATMKLGVRVVHLSRGQLATNGGLVERAVTILEAMNVRVLKPAEVRERLSLRGRR